MLGETELWIRIILIWIRIRIGGKANPTLDPATTYKNRKKFQLFSSFLKNQIYNTQNKDFFIFTILSFKLLTKKLCIKKMLVDFLFATRIHTGSVLLFGSGSGQMIRIHNTAVNDSFVTLDSRKLWMYPELLTTAL